MFCLLARDNQHISLIPDFPPTENMNITDSISMPTGMFYLIISCICNYVCIRSVFVLTTECTSLTVTLVITVRKFLTLLVSIFYFKNDFSYLHWVGTAMVFLGTAVYMDLVPLKKKEKEKNQ